MNAEDSAEVADIQDDPIMLLATMWRDAGRRAPVIAPNLTTASCIMPGCSGSSFVEIKTVEGLLPLCFHHFEAVRQASG